MRTMLSGGQVQALVRCRQSLKQATSLFILTYALPTFLAFARIIYRVRLLLELGESAIYNYAPFPQYKSRSL